jgi:hypothetical protein
MKKIFSTILLTLCFAARSETTITASITVTNMTTNGMTFTVNGNVRTFTNNVLSATTQVMTNADATGCGSKTNLFQQIGLNLFPRVTPFDTGSNTFQLQAPCGAALVVSASAGYADVTYSTQTCSTATPVGVAFDSYYPPLATRTNVASQLIADLNTYGTNEIDQSTPIAGQLLGTTNDQTVTGAKTFSNTNDLWYGGVVGASTISGNINWLSGGVITNATMLWISGSTTNAYIDSSSAIFPSGVQIPSSFANSWKMQGFAALGGWELVEQPVGGGSSTAVVLALTNAVTIFPALSLSKFSTVSNASIGTDLAITGSSTVGTNLNVGGNAYIAGLTTNQTWIGTNNFPSGADIAFGRYSIGSLANGNNSGVQVGTNCYVAVSGPTGSFTINGLANGRDGKVIIIENSTGQSLTLANDSGVDPAPANRIKTGTGADVTLTSNPAMATLIYSGSASRWILISHN